MKFLISSYCILKLGQHVLFLPYNSCRSCWLLSPNSFEGDKDLFVIRTHTSVLSPNKPMQLWHPLCAHSVPCWALVKNRSVTLASFPVWLFTSIFMFCFVFNVVFKELQLHPQQLWVGAGCAVQVNGSMGGGRCSSQ